MSRLSALDLDSRRVFDWRILRNMAGGRYLFSAHRTPQDAVNNRNSIDQERDARHALHYRCHFEVATLVGPGAYSQYTLMRIDASDAQYPFAPPTVWVIEEGMSRVPYSPHFSRRVPVCLGTIWAGHGRVTLGHLVIHLARLLNWQEQLSPGYGGYNPEAIRWWRQNVNRPLTPDLIYPSLPERDLYGTDAPWRPTDRNFRAPSATGRSENAGGFKRAV